MVKEISPTTLRQFLLIILISFCGFFSGPSLLRGPDGSVVGNKFRSPVPQALHSPENSAACCKANESPQGVVPVHESTVTTSTTLQVYTGENSTQQTIVSYARLDRTGSAILDMLRCQAYAFSHGFDYGGACPKRKRRKKFNENNFKDQRNDLIRMLGLNFEVYSECPKGVKIVKPDEYITQDAYAFAEEYIDYLQSISRFPTVHQVEQRARRITVHIRRGDINPCLNVRYLPNQHYLELIDLYQNQLAEQNSFPAATNSSEQAEVLIFSESESFESFDDFIQLGYKVELDGSLENVWRSIVFESDVVILSCSDFSLTAGVLSQALSPQPPIVVYTPFPTPPLPQFHNVETLYPAIQSSTKKLYRVLCKKFTESNGTKMDH